MVTVQILESFDKVDPEDWCRPLSITSMSGGMSDSYSFKSCYTGSPKNNVKWVKVKYIFGKCWHGCMVKDFLKGMQAYEFIRGDIPKSHRENLAGYHVTDHTTDLTEEDKDIDWY